MVPAPPITSPAPAAPPGAAELLIVIATAAEQFGVDPATLSRATTLRDLRADSLDRIEMAYATEEACGIELPDSATQAMNADTTLGDIAALVAAARAVA